MSIFLKNLDLSKLKKTRRSSSTVPKTLTEPKASSRKSNSSAAQQAQFPAKLYQMLNEVEEHGLDHIVSWQHDGRSFRVHQPAKFVETILPSFFRCRKMKSFQRQLNFYRFIRVVGGPLDGSYSHPKFIRGEKEMASSIRRQLDPRGSETSGIISSRADSISSNDEDDNDDDRSSENVDDRRFLLVENTITVSKPPVVDRHDSQQVSHEATSGGMECERQESLQEGDKRESFHEGKRFSYAGKNFFFLSVEFTDLYPVSNE